jgi:hypothetical protein
MKRGLIALALVAALATPAAADPAIVSGWDHMSIGQGSFNGFHIGGGVGNSWGSVETTYRYATGSGYTVNGLSGDGYLRWRNYFVTAGATYYDFASKGDHANEFAPRVGLGLQFGFARVALRYERTTKGDGLSLAVGVVLQ